MRAETTEGDEVIAARGNWGRWGAEDEPAFNLLTPETVLEAMRERAPGRVYALGAPVGREGVPVFGFRPARDGVTLYNNATTSWATPCPRASARRRTSSPSPATTRRTSTRSATSTTATSSSTAIRRTGLRPFTGAERCRARGSQSAGSRRGACSSTVGDGDVLAPGEVVGVDWERVLAPGLHTATRSSCAPAGWRPCSPTPDSSSPAPGPGHRPRARAVAGRVRPRRGGRGQHGGRGHPAAHRRARPAHRAAQ